MVLRSSAVIQTYGNPEMRASVSGKHMVFVRGFIKQMKDEKPLWITIVLCADKYGKLVPNIRPKTKLWVSGIMAIEPFMAKDCSSSGVKLKIFAEGVEVIAWGPSIDREALVQEKEPEPPAESTEETTEESEEYELFPF